MAKEKKERPAKKEKPPKKERVPRSERKAKKAKGEKEETLLQKLKRQKDGKIYPDDEPVSEESPPEGQEEAPGKQKSKLFLLIGAAVLLLAAVAIVVIFVILPRFSGDRDPEPDESATPEPVLYDLPASFQVGEETVTGVVPVNPNGVQATEDVRVCFTYTGMSDAGAEAEAYVANLKAEKFSVVNEEFVRTDAPDYATAEGTVLLARNIAKKGEASAADAGGSNTDAPASPDPSNSADPTASPDPGSSADPSASPAPGSSADPSASPAPEEEQKDMVLTVELSWSEGSMVVVCDQAEGKVTSPPRDQMSMTPGASMSMSEAVDYLYTLEPSALGLSGTSMDSYRIYALDGAVMVNNQPCMRLSIYSREGPDQTNEVAGIYLLTRDGAHLYQLDESAGTVKEVKLP